jgi:glycosyltransferase involved in cell wall biosynthesis
MPQPAVAIITRTKNRPILLPRAIESVLSQSFKDWIHVIVNDGGDPAELEAVIEPHLPAYKGRLSIVHHAASLGMEAASNAGIHSSQSEFLVIHDDDDSWAPTFLERCHAFMTSNQAPLLASGEYGGVVTQSRRVLEKIVDQDIVVLRDEPFNEWMKSVSLFRLACSNTFPPISFFFRRSVLDRIGYFREDLPVLGDWDFHLRVCTHYEIGVIPEAIANYHHRITTKTGAYGNTVITADSKHRTYENLYRNEALRRDLEAGRLGMGFMMAMSAHLELLHATVWPVAAFLNKIKGNRFSQALATLMRKQRSL